MQTPEAEMRDTGEAAPARPGPAPSTGFPYRLSGPIGSRATLGLVVLSVDETVEQDFRRMFPSPDVALCVSRVPSGAEVSPATLRAMEAALPAAAGLLPASLDFHAVGYACTSGTTVIGAERVAALVQGAATARAVTNPLTAAIAAFRALGVARIGLVTPYVAEVSAALRDAFAAAGVTTGRLVSFEEAEEARVARIDPASIREAALHAGRPPEVEAVFLSCTNLRTLDVLGPVAAELGKPVLSSNQVLGWHMATLAGLADGASPADWTGEA